jgi:hypothetical protein
LIYLRGIKYFSLHDSSLLENIELEEIKKLEKELSNSFKSYIAYNKQKIKEI